MMQVITKTEEDMCKYQKAAVNDTTVESLGKQWYVTAIVGRSVTLTEIVNDE